MNIKSIGGLMLVAGMISVLAGAPCAKAGGGDEKAVLAANAEFYKALNQMFATPLNGESVRPSQNLIQAFDFRQSHPLFPARPSSDFMRALVRLMLAAR